MLSLTALGFNLGRFERTEVGMNISDRGESRMGNISQARVFGDLCHDLGLNHDLMYKFKRGQDAYNRLYRNSATISPSSNPCHRLTNERCLFPFLSQSQKTSVLFHAMISELKQLADVAQPTSFHHLLKRLDVEGRLLRVYTQNIDALEERAGLTFGLGETGDGTSTKRSLVGGKRKRNLKGKGVEEEASGSGTSGSRSGTWGRSQSDSALLVNKRNQDRAQSQQEEADSSKKPMFPRVVPLHGSLKTLTCRICAHKLILPNSQDVASEASTSSHQILTIPEEEEEIPESKGKTRSARTSTQLKRRFSSSHPSQHKEIGSRSNSDLEESEDESFNTESRLEEEGPLVPTTPAMALQLLATGDSIPCPRCEVANEVRLIGGLRSRGVGLMKVDVVLYGGQNEGAERVGQCLERDVLGLRDPSEPPVPESLRERQGRERKEMKERENFQKEMQLREDLGVGEGQQLKVFGNPEDALKAAFEDEDQEQAVFPSSSQPLPNRKGNAAGRPKLKPLPPDLLIVAGTSLKVPGTKRIVREFSKACKARDRIVYPSDDESEGEESSTAGSGRRGTRSFTRRTTPSSVGGDDEDEEDEEDNPNLPIRTVLLNYDFPIPAKEWDGVFDFWLRGDLQRASRGLWPSGNPIAARDPFFEVEAKEKAQFLQEPPTAPGPFEEKLVSPEVYNHPAPPTSESWAPLLTALEEKRQSDRKLQRAVSRSKNSRSQTPSTIPEETDLFTNSGSSPLSSITSTSSKGSSTKTVKSKKTGTAAAATIAGANKAVGGKGTGKAKASSSSPPAASTSKSKKKATSSSAPTKKAVVSNKAKGKTQPRVTIRKVKADDQDAEMVDELLSSSSSSPQPEVQVIVGARAAPKKRASKKQAVLAGSGTFESVKKGTKNNAVETLTSGKNK